MNYDLSLPPPARSVQLVEQLYARGTQPEIQELVSLLEFDPITTVHLLRQVNSPIYALRQSVASIDRAATMMGFDALANTVFVESHVENARPLANGVGSLAYAYLVQTSVAAGLIADALAHHLKMEQHGIVRTAALIHQLGRMALLSADPQTYLKLWREATTPSGRAIAIPPGIGREIVHFRTDYTRHGERLAMNWKFPPDLAESARYHADPERIEDAEHDTVLVVAVSQFAARTMFESGEDLKRDQGAQRVEKATMALSRSFNLSRTDLDDFLTVTKRSAYEEAIQLSL